MKPRGYKEALGRSGVAFSSGAERGTDSRVQAKWEGQAPLPSPSEQGDTEEAAVSTMINDADEVWTPHLVHIMFSTFPETSAYVVKEHYLDPFVRLGARPSDIRNACPILQDEIAKVKENAEKGSDPVSLFGALHLSNSSPTMASLVRKALMTRIKVLAPVEVQIWHNSSSLLDEVIAHRLGLVAVSAPEGLEEKSVTGQLKSTSKEVFGKEIEFNVKDVRVAQSYADTVILTLQPGCCINLTFTLRWGSATGADAHDRFSAVVAPSYRPTIYARGELVHALENLGYISHALDSLCDPEPKDTRMWRKIASGPKGDTVRYEAVEEAAVDLMKGKASGSAATDHCLLSSRDYKIEFESHGQHTASRCITLALEVVSAEVEELSNRFSDGAPAL